jgi:hypothetical protein
VLVQTLLVLGNRSIVLFTDVVDQDDSIMSPTGYKVGILNTKLACCYFGLAVEDLLGESWIFESPEHQQPFFSSFVALLIVLVSDSQQIFVDWVPICAGDRVAFELFGGECEEVMKSFFVDVLLFLFFLLLGEAQDFVFRTFLDELYLWVISVGDVFFVESLAVEDAIDVL